MSTGKPGSPEAVAARCTCPVLENGHGRGRGDGTFWISASCPLHAQAEGEHRDPEAAKLALDGGAEE